MEYNVQWCSIFVVIILFTPRSRTAERMIQLFPSVPQEVKMISEDETLNFLAIVLRAVSISAFECLPIEYVDEGFPKSLVKTFIISSTTSFLTEVVAALSRYIDRKSVV